jgi:hypothetical protein
MWRLHILRQLRRLSDNRLKHFDPFARNGVNRQFSAVQVRAVLHLRRDRSAWPARFILASVIFLQERPSFDGVGSRQCAAVPGFGLFSGAVAAFRRRVGRTRTEGGTTIAAVDFKIFRSCISMLQSYANR